MVENDVWGEGLNICSVEEVKRSQTGGKRKSLNCQNCLKERSSAWRTGRGVLEECWPGWDAVSGYSGGKIWGMWEEDLGQILKCGYSE